MAKRGRVAPSLKLQNTTIRDFSGGLNVVDSEQSLTSRFAPVFDNCVMDNDRSAGPRFGYEMWLKTKTGTTNNGVGQSMLLTTTNGSRIINIGWTAHPFSLGGAAQLLQHIGLSYDGPTIGVGGIPYTDIMGDNEYLFHGILVIDADNFQICVRTEATSNAALAYTLDWSSDTHMLGDKPVDAKYFSNYVIVVSTTGEIIKIDSEKTITRIWSFAISNALAGSPIPWSATDIVAWDVFANELLLSNGRDKPLYIDFTNAINVNYQVDPGNAFSNDKIPAFDACKAAFKYFNVHDTATDHETEVRITDRLTSVVYSDAPSPGEAVDVDISKIIASSEQSVRAFAVIKDTLLAIMPNSTVMLKLGIYDAASNHDPDPVDTLTNFGTSAMRSVVEIANDVFMIDYNGVPSAKLSSLNNAVVPSRISDNIETMIAKHIGRLSKETMRLHAFGLWDSKNKMIHFYLPKFDEDNLLFLPRDPFYYAASMAGTQTLIMWAPKHQTEVGDIVRVVCSTAVGAIAAVDITGDREVVGVLNEDYVLIAIDATIPDDNQSGGDVGCTAQPLNDESIGYVYRYMPATKTFGWSRFKGMQFLCGCGTLEGRTFFFDEDGHMFRYGSPDAPVYGDWYNMYDYASWVSGQTYPINSRVYDGADNAVYINSEETSAVAATFAAARNMSTIWTLYQGEPIEFAHELPWADFGARQNTKTIRFFHADATGDAEFTVQLFVDNQYKNAETGELRPARTLTFVGNDAGGFGVGQQPYAGGRRTREQRLWAMPIKCKLMKVRLTGSTTKKLRINALSFLHARGSLVRG